MSAALVKIDELNQSMQAQFRAAYAVFQASPCTELPYFRAAVEIIIIDEQKLRQIQTIVDKLNITIAGRSKNSQAGAEVAKIVDTQLKIIASALLPAAERQLVDKMSEVQQLTEEWKGNE